MLFDTFRQNDKCYDPNYDAEASTDAPEDAFNSYEGQIEENANDGMAHE